MNQTELNLMKSLVKGQKQRGVTHEQFYAEQKERIAISVKIGVLSAGEAITELNKWMRAFEEV